MNAGLLVLRLVVGVTFLMHGLDKLGDLAGTEELFASLEIPAPGPMAPFVALDLPRHLRAAGTRTRDWTRHSPRRERARAGAKVTT